MTVKCSGSQGLETYKEEDVGNSVKYHIQINRTRHEAAGLGGLLSQSSRHLGPGGKNHITKGQGVREGLG